MSNIPKISVITPVKNGAATLEKTIQSLLNQDYPNLEYIIIDGASTDGTLDIVKKYQEHVAYFESEDDGNNVIAHIKGIKKATGDLVAFLNADDFYEPGVLKKIAEAFQEDQTLDIISTRCRTIEIGENKEYKVLNEASLEDMELYHDKMFTIPAPNARFFKRDLFLKYGFQKTHDDQGRTLISNDVEYLIRFLFKGVKTKTLDILGYSYLAHEDSLTFSQDFKTQKRLCEDKIYIGKKFLASNEFSLSKSWKKTFTKWIKKYRAKMIVVNVREKKWHEAWQNFSKGMQESSNFTFYLVKSLFRG
jgi:glycosyltransferase involved in cell wall biosynthesis